MSHRLAPFVVASISLLGEACASRQAWPAARGGSQVASPAAGRDDDDELVRSLPVCIASSTWSSGELGASVLYRFEHVGRRISVGYFVYWTAERPWGRNLLSYMVLPAFFIDAFYSHLFFVFPGAQHYLYGPGDIEGARIVYEQNGDGRWAPISAAADDAGHREVMLAPEDFIDNTGAVVLTTRVWSHQLGTRRNGAEAREPPTRKSCFVGASLSPLTPEVAAAFRLGSTDDPRRAPPAWRLAAPATADRAPARGVSGRPAISSSRVAANVSSR